MDIEEAFMRPFQLENPTDKILEGRILNIITMGCAHNHADSDVIASAFLTHGAAVGSYEAADIIYVNSCTVKTPSQDKAINQACKAAEAGKTVILGGCVPQSMRTESRIQHLVDEKKLTLIGVLDDVQLQELVKNVAGHIQTTIFTKKAVHDPALLPLYHITSHADVIPLCQGCQGSCTYCKTVQSRGRLISYQLDSILARVDAAIASPNIQELWLTGEDTLAWGLEQGKGFYDILQPVLEHLDRAGSRKMVRLGMTDPESVLHQGENLVAVLTHPNVYRFLHLPVQSASDAVLGQMRRRYSYAAYKEFIKFLYARVPGLVVATDIIVGFPGETDDDHSATIECLQELKFQIVNITQYYTRPGTLAAKWAQVPDDIKKRRSAEAARVAVEHFNRERYVGSEEEVIISEVLPSFKHDRVLGAKTNNYLSVLIQQEGAEQRSREEVLSQLSSAGIIIGARVKVRITAATRVALAGVLVQ